MLEWKNFRAGNLTKCSIDLHNIWPSVDTCSSDELHTHCALKNLFFRERNPTFVISQKKNKQTKQKKNKKKKQRKQNKTNKQNNITLYFKPISFKLDVMIETSKLYIMISVPMTLTLIQGHSCMRYQISLCPFSRKTFN